MLASHTAIIVCKMLYPNQLNILTLHWGVSLHKFLAFFPPTLNCILLLPNSPPTKWVPKSAAAVVIYVLSCSNITFIPLENNLLSRDDYRLPVRYIYLNFVAQTSSKSSDLILLMISLCCTLTCQIILQQSASKIRVIPKYLYDLLTLRYIFLLPKPHHSVVP